MKSGKALFVIDTPSQVFNVTEALRAYPIVSYDVMICDCCRADAYMQLKRLLVSLNPKHRIDVEKVSGPIEDRIGIYAKHVSWLKAQDYQWVFFSNIRQQWQRDVVCSLPQSQPVLMDDGNATLVFYRYLFTRRKFFDFPPDLDEARAEKAHATRLKYGVAVDEPAGLELFTIFQLNALPWLTVRANPMSALCRTHGSVDQDLVLFLGIGAVELGYATSAQYIEYLQQVAHMYQGKRIIYQPHRISSPELIEQIGLHTEFELMRLHEPVEDWLYRHPSPPAQVVSFFSMALSTISVCFPSIRVTSIDAGPQAWMGAKQSHVWNLTCCNNLDIIHTIMDYLKVDPAVSVLPLIGTNLEPQELLSPPALAGE